MNRFLRLAVAGAALTLTLGPAVSVAAQSTGKKCTNCGKVEQIRVSESSDWKKYAAPVGGAVVGGVIGNQFGGGSGKTLLTIAGAVGGGLVGHKVESGSRDKIYEVIVRMDDGSHRTVTYKSPPPVRDGDRVRLRDGQLVVVES
ncbi:MAG TPA: glycine zipper 2TM domain-containing protein [Burkholderiales bacterium]|nr:glycine zipper 2TM domain-containing protein [Burkholderiales bacterium]